MYAGRVVDARRGDNNGLGNTVTVRQDDGKFVQYNHLADVAVESGQRVKSGTPLGGLGNTGNSGGPHLDLRVRDSANGAWRDPTKSDQIRALSTRGPVEIVSPVRTPTAKPSLADLLGVTETPAPQGVLGDITAPQSQFAQSAAPTVAEEAAALFGQAAPAPAASSATTAPGAPAVPEIGGLFAAPGAKATTGPDPLASLSGAPAAEPTLADILAATSPAAPSTGVLGPMTPDPLGAVGSPNPAVDIGPQTAATPVTGLTPATPSPSTATPVIGRDPGEEKSGLQVQDGAFLGTAPSSLFGEPNTLAAHTANTSAALAASAAPAAPAAPAATPSTTATPATSTTDIATRFSNATGVLGELADHMADDPVSQAMYDIQNGTGVLGQPASTSVHMASQAETPTVAAPVSAEPQTAMGPPQVSAPRVAAPQPSYSVSQPTFATAPQAVQAPTMAASQISAPQATSQVSPVPGSTFSTADIVPGLARSIASGIASYGINTPNNARLGYSPLGGAAAVYDSAPERVQIAATGPGLFGSMGGFGSAAESQLARTAVGRTAGIPAGILGGLAGTAVAGPAGGVLGGLLGNVVGGRLAAGAAQRAGTSFSGQTSEPGGGVLGGFLGSISGLGSTSTDPTTSNDFYDPGSFFGGSSRVGPGETSRI